MATPRAAAMVRAAALAAVLPCATLAQDAAAPAGPAAPPYAACRDRTAAGDRARSGMPRRQGSRATAAPGVRELEQSVRAWEEEAKAFRAEVQGLVQTRFDARRRFLADHYEQAIRDLEVLERNEREATIIRLEEFLARYPDDPALTPDAMFRLAELYYEKANDDHELAVSAHREEARRTAAEGRDPPPEPLRSYAPSIALYQQLITGFPGCRYADGIHYLLAYCLAEMGQGEEARVAYERLIQRYPESPFVPEAWVRLGDWWFDGDASELPRAAGAFARLLRYPDHPLFARAIYKLGWTWYRLDEFARAVDAFTRLLDHYVAKAAETGARPGGDVWPEAIQYTALSFADARWGGIDKARAFFASRGGRPYEAEVYARLGDVYLEEARYALAADAYHQVLAAEPLSVDAPRIQARIVVAWSRDGQLEKEAREREILVTTYSEGTRWWERNAGDPGVVATVRELVASSLLGAASFHHGRAQTLAREGRTDGAAGEYRTAARAYGDYLARFRHSKEAYEVAYRQADCLFSARDFEAAARAYAAVRDDPAGDRFEADAALAAVLAREEEIARLQRAGALAVRKVLRPAERAGAGPGPVRAGPVPEPHLALVRDSDVLVARFPGHEKAPAIAYKAGEVFYAHGDLDEARCRLEEVVDRWPAAEVARFAANLVVETHLAVKDWAAVEESAARLQAKEVAKDPALRAALQKLKLGGRFNRAVEAMAAKDWERAAQLFVALVDEEPRHEFADKALYNAASSLESARRVDAALALYDRVAAEYPSSPLADAALFRVGYDAESAFEFEKAAARYLALVERYPASKHRKDALYNAARALENLQRYGESAAAFARYAALHPDADDAARAQLHAAVVYGKMADRRREVDALEQLVKRFSRTKEHELVVQAHLAMALARRELGDADGAREAYAAALGEFGRRGLRPEEHPRAAAAAAEARFRLAEYELERYDRIRLPATPDTKKLKKALEAKLAEARKVAPQYDEVMRFKRPDWILAAFYRKAFLLERLAQTIVDAPVPPEFQRKGAEEYLAAYQDALAQAAQPYEEQAVEVYVQAIEAARKLHVKNEWTKKIGESLARYRPRDYPVLREPRARLVVEDLSPSRLSDTLDGPSRPPLPDAAARGATAQAQGAPAIE
jgi:TolA-binding protein